MPYAILRLESISVLKAKMLAQLSPKQSKSVTDALGKPERIWWTYDHIFG